MARRTTILCVCSRCYKLDNRLRKRSRENAKYHLEKYGPAPTVTAGTHAAPEVEGHLGQGLVNDSEQIQVDGMFFPLSFVIECETNTDLVGHTSLGNADLDYDAPPPPFELIPPQRQQTPPPSPPYHAPSEPSRRVTQLFGGAAMGRDISESPDRGRSALPCSTSTLR